MLCAVHGCERDRDPRGEDLCFTHKLKTVGFTGVVRMRKNREDNTTQAEIKQEIFDDCRADGVDIKKAGSTSPTSGPLLT